ncbi:hypothetical protein PGTUg99_011576 [Puccinia graminis f. sp. tritici]|uniref:Uncharacterized protein n=1 Tax=Puccinia graminis f. sp. tritici TaxID=56615 RepID=A0A5B0N0T7_PUCGR|nr:hypothetical protein PGTUg99_011576 [Puccinia graminis f. sp. tritici]
MQTDATKLWCIASHRFADAILIHCIEESDASNAMRGPASLLRCDAIKARYDAIPMHASHQFHPLTALASRFWCKTTLSGAERHAAQKWDWSARLTDTSYHSQDAHQSPPKSITNHPWTHEPIPTAEPQEAPSPLIFLSEPARSWLGRITEVLSFTNPKTTNEQERHWGWRLDDVETMEWTTIDLLE